MTQSGPFVTLSPGAVALPGPVVLKAQVEVVTLEAMPPNRVDLRDVARRKGATLDQDLPPC